MKERGEGNGTHEIRYRKLHIFFRDFESKQNIPRTPYVSHGTRTAKLI